MTDAFQAPSSAALRDLIARYPLAWVISPGAEGVPSTPLPLLGNYDARGELVSLTGHIARRNPHCAVLERESRARILFQGPQGYLSPSWQSDPRWGPTWNYAVVQVAARVVMQPEQTDTALRRLVETMEAEHGGGWHVDLMGERYAQLRRHVVAFEARVDSVRARFKMGQDEHVDTLRQFLALLEGDTGAASDSLAQCMRECNAARLSPS